MHANYVVCAAMETFTTSDKRNGYAVASLCKSAISRNDKLLLSQKSAEAHFVLPLPFLAPTTIWWQVEKRGSASQGYYSVQFLFVVFVLIA
jgi:hypothetical protein